MATQKQIAANRENAKKSTGPRTDAGKHRVSRNGLRHGLLSTVSVIPGESPADYDNNLSNFQDMYWPSNPFEHALVRQMADAEWRLQRISRLQSAYITSGVTNRSSHQQQFHADKPDPAAASTTSAPSPAPAPPTSTASRATKPNSSASS